MIITPHLLIGAAIGAKIKYLGWIIVLGLLSHFILDKIPHWDYGNRAFQKFKKNKSYKILFIFFLQLMIDGLIGLVIVLFIVWQKNIVEPKHLLFILIGILASLLPDILLGTSWLFHNKFKKFSKIWINFHEKILHCPKHILKLTLLGLGTEILVSIIAILILLL